MNKMYLFIVIICSAISIIERGDADVWPQQIAEGKKTLIRELILCDDQKHFAEQSFEEIYKSLKDKSIQVPPKMWKEILSEIDMDKLMEELIPVYDKYLSSEEIQQLLKYKPSSENEKEAQRKTKLFQKKLKINAIWGHKLVIKIQQKLWDKNINLDIYDELDEYDANHFT
jgi:uncharacterized protein